MSQSHNLQPEDLPLEDLQPAAPLAAVPTRTTDRTGARAAQEHPAPTHPDATEAPMATPTSPSTKPAPVPHPDGTAARRPPDAPAASGYGRNQLLQEPVRRLLGRLSLAVRLMARSVVGADVMGMLAAVARPRLASVVWWVG